MAHPRPAQRLAQQLALSALSEGRIEDGTAVTAGGFDGAADQGFVSAARHLRAVKLRARGGIATDVELDASQLLACAIRRKHRPPERVPDRTRDRALASADAAHH